MTGPDAPTEADSDRDGLLSYSKEWHALAHGVYKGLTGMRPGAETKDSKKELHYFRGGFVVGRLLQLVVAAISGALTL